MVQGERDIGVSVCVPLSFSQFRLASIAGRRSGKQAHASLNERREVKRPDSRERRKSSLDFAWKLSETKDPEFSPKFNLPF